MDESLHYLIMANQMLVQKALMERIKDTGLTIGQPKILDYFNGNRRTFHIFMTEEGEEKQKLIDKNFQQIEERALSGISEEEMEKFMSVSKKIYSNLQEKRNE